MAADSLAAAQAPGPDGSPEELVQVIPSTLLPLAKLFTRNLVQGRIPTALPDAKKNSETVRI